jgi:hypothetical protein
MLKVHIDGRRGFVFQQCRRNLGVGQVGGKRKRDCGR